MLAGCRSKAAVRQRAKLVSEALRLLHAEIPVSPSHLLLTDADVHSVVLAAIFKATLAQSTRLSTDDVVSPRSPTEGTSPNVLANDGRRQPPPRNRRMSSSGESDVTDGVKDEESLRTWINSLGLECYCHSLFGEDVRSGWLLLLVIDKVAPGRGLNFFFKIYIFNFVVCPVDRLLFN